VTSSRSFDDPFFFDAAGIPPQFLSIIDQSRDTARGQSSPAAAAAAANADTETV